MHFRSTVFRAPSQHKPFSSSPFTLCIDKSCSSNCPDPSDTCGRHDSRFKPRKSQKVPQARPLPDFICTCYAFYCYCFSEFASPRTFQAIKVHPGSRTNRAAVERNARTCARKQRRKAATTEPRLDTMPPDCCCHSFALFVRPTLGTKALLCCEHAQLEAN